MALPESEKATKLLYCPIRGDVWDVSAQPGHFNSLVRELVLGPAAPEFGSPDSHFPVGVEGMDAETLEVHSCVSWVARGFPKLLIVLDAEGLAKGLRPNPRCTYVLNGGADPGLDSGLTVYGPACIFADASATEGSEKEPEFTKEDLFRLLATRGKGSLDSFLWETSQAGEPGSEGDKVADLEVELATEKSALAERDSDDDEEMVEVDSY